MTDTTVKDLIEALQKLPPSLPVMKKDTSGSYTLLDPFSIDHYISIDYGRQHKINRTEGLHFYRKSHRDDTVFLKKAEPSDFIEVLAL